MQDSPTITRAKGLSLRRIGRVNRGGWAGKPALAAAV